jgi:hypothetical protein
VRDLQVSHIPGVRWTWLSASIPPGSARGETSPQPAIGYERPKREGGRLMPDSVEHRQTPKPDIVHELIHLPSIGNLQPTSESCWSISAQRASSRSRGFMVYSRPTTLTCQLAGLKDPVEALPAGSGNLELLGHLPAATPRRPHVPESRQSPHTADATSEPDSVHGRFRDRSTAGIAVRLRSLPDEVPTVYEGGKQNVRPTA